MKMRKLWAVLLAAALCVTGCGGGGGGTSTTGAAGETQGGQTGQAGDTGRTVHVAYQAIADSMEPSGLLGVAETICFAQTYDALLSRGADNVIEPGIAETWEVSEDGLTYTFHLNQEVTWSDGEDVTADDVKFSLELFKESGSHSWVFEEVQTVNVLDENTVEVILSSPKASLLSSLSNPMHFCLVAQHAYEEWGDEYGSSVDKIVSTGPYKLVDWQPDVSMTFEAREDYYRGTPDIQQLVLHQITDKNAAIVALQTGELDVYFEPISGSSYETLAADSSITLDEYLSARFECIHFYYKDGIFSDVRMRQAVAYAVNPEEALTVGAEGMGQLIRYPGDIGSVMTGNPDYTPSIQYEYDLEKAKALVEECGNVGAPVVIKSYNTEPYATLAVWLQSVLTSIGLDATVEPMERASFLAACDGEEVPILTLGWNGQAYDMDESLGNLVYSGSVGSTGNYGFYVEEEMDQLVLQGRAETDPEARKEIYRQMIEKIMEDVPLVPLYVVKTVIPHRADLTTDNIRGYCMFDWNWVE